MLTVSSDPYMTDSAYGIEAQEDGVFVSPRMEAEGYGFWLRDPHYIARIQLG